MIDVISDEKTWNEHVLSMDGHPLQLWGWGAVKSAYNWKAERILVRNGNEVIGGAQLLIRPLPAPFRALVYVPRGPFGASETVARELPAYIKSAWHPTYLCIEPNSESFTAWKGWRKSPNSILLARTIALDLTLSEEQLLAGMAKKTRQYIRKSANEGVNIQRVTSPEAIEECLAIYKQTAERAGFDLHDDEYYHTIHRQMGEASVVFGAYKGQELVAFVWLVVSQHTAFELYGGMNDEGQKLRANYSLKWHAIRKCREWGVGAYDMNGLLNDGISTFKQGFAEQETVLAGAYDYPLSPLYYVWTTLLPSIKNLVRMAKRSKR